MSKDGVEKLVVIWFDSLCNIQVNASRVLPL